MPIKDVEPKNGSNLNRDTVNYLTISSLSKPKLVQLSKQTRWMVDYSMVPELKTLTYSEKLTKCSLFIRADFNDATGVSRLHTELRS